jgi:hypothetical protein
MNIPRTSTVIALIKQCFADGWNVTSLRPILADAMQDGGFEDEVILKKLRSPVNVWMRIEDFVDVAWGIPEELCEGNWKHCFAYAGEPDAGDGEASIKSARPGEDIPLTSFSRWDVAQVLGTSEGENNVQNWLCYGQLRDGRYFFLTSGCDYTGWG